MLREQYFVPVQTADLFQSIYLQNGTYQLYKYQQCFLAFIDLWKQDVNWMYARRSEEVQDVFWTSITGVQFTSSE